jgi:O-antigen/teichoic acid export membrane protein
MAGSYEKYPYDLIANKKFITLWVGEDNFGGIALNFVFIYWILQDTIYRGTTAILFASGNLKKWTYTSILEAILNIVISIFLAKNFGLIGVALGTSISKTFTTGLLTPYYICKEINMPFKIFIINGIIKPFIICIPGIILTWVISFLLPENLGQTQYNIEPTTQQIQKNIKMTFLNLSKYNLSQYTSLFR